MPFKPIVSLLCVMVVALGCSAEFTNAFGGGPMQPGQPNGRPGQPIAAPGTGGSAGSGVAGSGPTGVGGMVGAPPFSLGTTANLAPRLRLKSNDEIYAGIRQALGVSPAPSLPKEPLQKLTGFLNDSTAHRVGEGLFLALQTLAAEAATAVPEMTVYRYCTQKVATDATCARQTAVGFTKALLARDPTTDELTALLNIHSKVVTAGGSIEALRAIIEALVQLPSFLYRTEFGDPAIRNAKSPLTPYEVAWALASFLWAAPPDDELVAAIAGGTLSTPAGIEQQARRMLRHPNARTAFSRFALQWIDVRDLELQLKDLQAFPTYSAAVAKSMTEETRLFAAAAVFDEDSTLKTLLTGKTTYLDKTLSTFYGFGNVQGTQFEKVSVPALKAGILTHGSFNVGHSGERETSPIRRGYFVRTKMLCGEIGAPPPTAPTTVANATMGQTVQDVFNQHKLNGCSGCHLQMNPIGFGFENIDAVGKTRQIYNNTVIDSSGEIINFATGSSVPFTAGTGLYDTMASMPEVSDCFTLRLYQYALGRQAGEQENADLDQLAGKFRSDKRITELLVSIVTSQRFLTRKTD